MGFKCESCDTYHSTNKNIGVCDTCGKGCKYCCRNIASHLGEAYSCCICRRSPDDIDIPENSQRFIEED